MKKLENRRKKKAEHGEEMGKNDWERKMPKE